MFIAHHTTWQAWFKLRIRVVFFSHLAESQFVFIHTVQQEPVFYPRTDSSANKKNNLLCEIDPLVFKAARTPPSEFVGQASVKYTEVRDLKAKVPVLVYDNEGFSSPHS